MKKKTIKGSQEVGVSFHVQALHMMRQWTCEETVSMEEMAQFCYHFAQYCHERCIEVTLHAKIY